jgi:hypothetical protein
MFPIRCRSQTWFSTMSRTLGPFFVRFFVWSILDIDDNEWVLMLVFYWDAISAYNASVIRQYRELFKLHLELIPLVLLGECFLNAS